MIETLITSSVLITFLAIIRRVFKGKISPRLQYALWGLVVIRLIMPYNYFIPDNIHSPLSVMNVVNSIETEMLSNTNLKPLLINIRTGLMTKYDTTLDYSSSNDITEDVSRIPLIVRAAELDWQLYIMIIWGVGTVSMSLWMFLVNRHFSNYLKANRKTYINMGYELPIYVVPNLSSPCLYSIDTKPAVYITPHLLDDSEKLEHVLIHEYCHYKRNDHIWSVVRCGLLAFYWVNPFIWLAAYLSKRDCELACDEATIAKLGEEKRLSYGRTLIQLISSKTTPKDLMSVATSMTASKKGITERINMIAKKPRMLRTTVISVCLLIVIAVVLTFTTSKSNDSTTSITPTVPTWNSDMILGADGPVLDYASLDYIIFHGYFGLFVYDLNSQAIIRSIDLKPIGCNYTQGDNYCEVSVSKDGLTVYLHNVSSDMMYVYQVEENTLDYVDYEEMDTKFSDFIDIKTVLGKNGNYSYDAVELNIDNSVQYGYLYYSDWTIGSLEYIVGNDKYKLFAD